MHDTKFIKRLRKELPYWSERGWVSAGSERAIIDSVATQGGGTHMLAYALGILGVLLLGSGVITWFAANWDNMAKLAKLLMLFGAMWAAYAAAETLQRTERAPRTGQAVLLLGVILFGANIWLIAQIYHIDSHYPNGVLLWSLGALLTAWLLRSLPAMMAAIGLAILWTVLESVGFGREVHWWFLVMWLFFLPMVFRREWRPSLHLAMIGLLIWSLFTFKVMALTSGERAALYLVQLYFLVYLVIYLIGMVMATVERLRASAGVIQRYSIIGVLVTLYALTFPHLHTWKPYWQTGLPTTDVSTTWIVWTMSAITLIVALALWHRRLTQGPKRPGYLVWGQALIVAGVILILVNLFVTGEVGGLMGLGFNLLMFTGLVWLVYAGIHLENRYLINTAFVFFALTLFSRYFDTFWSLINRSFFFMFGGLLLLVGGYYLEMQRRKLTVKMAVDNNGENRS